MAEATANMAEAQPKPLTATAMARGGKLRGNLEPSFEPSGAAPKLGDTAADNAPLNPDATARDVAERSCSPRLSPQQLTRRKAPRKIP